MPATPKARGASSRSRVRVRSFAGCLTCRTRKVKCDEARPSCRQCSRSALVCGGYEAKIRFLLYAPDGPISPSGAHQSDAAHSRRILFTEPARKAMSKQLQDLVHEDDLDQVLENLDSAPEVAMGEQNSLFPFSAFQLNSPSDSGDLPEPSPTPVPPIDDALLDHAETNEPQVVGSTDVCTWADPGSNYATSLSLEDITSVIPCIESPAWDLLPSDSWWFPQTDLVGTPLSMPFQLDVSPVLKPRDESLSSHANFLLGHYKSQMGIIFSPLRARKPPWSILHLPRALSTLSELNIFNKASHAAASLLYAVLAVSAFNWDNIHGESRDSTTYWRAIGERFQLSAKSELEKTCQTEIEGEKTSKYKDVLMAILTMVTIAVVTGRQQEARSFLLNAESFIRVRGVPKTHKSRKVKLLHSIYLYLRVVEESTYIYPLDNHRTASSSLPDDQMLFPSLRTHSLCLGKDIDMCCGSNFELGMFEGSSTPGGRTCPQLFKGVYGFSQDLLSFISRATSLANEIAILQCRSPEISMTAELESRCKVLEKDICAWSEDGGTDAEIEDPTIAFANRAIMPYLTVAFHSAVLIFFYRRVRGVNPIILQPYVEKTIQNLESFEGEQRNHCLVNAGITWPGFIAGAEALDSSLQDRFQRFLRGSATWSGMRNFVLAADVLRDLWRKRSEAGDWNITWMDLIRDQQLAVVFT